MSEVWLSIQKGSQHVMKLHPTASQIVPTIICCHGYIWPESHSPRKVADRDDGLMVRQSYKTWIMSTHYGIPISKYVFESS